MACSRRVEYAIEPQIHDAVFPRRENSVRCFAIEVVVQGQRRAEGERLAGNRPMQRVEPAQPARGHVVEVAASVEVESAFRQWNRGFV